MLLLSGILEIVRFYFVYRLWYYYETLLATLRLTVGILIIFFFHAKAPSI